MVPLSFLLLENTSIFEQLQIEEALLRADERNWCVINTGSSPAIVMGISGKPELLIQREQFMQSPLPLIRRFSGGGTVIVDEHTVFVTWIFNSDSIQVPCFPQPIYKWTTSWYQKALSSLEMCLNESDYAIGERKFGGNAQYLRKGRWLHHSSLLWDYQAENMSYLLMPAKTPVYREGRGHEDFLCRLKDHIPEKKLFQQQLVKAIESSFNVQEISLDEIAKIRQQTHRQATEYVNWK